MPCSYYYNAECNCAVLTIEGHATLADILAGIYHLIEDESFQSDICVIVDWRQFYGGFPPIAARAVRDLEDRMAAEPLVSCKIAWLVRHEDHLADALAEAQSDEVPQVQRRAFTATDEALEWLGLKGIPPPTSLVWTTTPEWKETERASLPGALSFVRQENSTTFRFIIRADKHQVALARHAMGPYSELFQLWNDSPSVGDQVATLLEVVRRVEYTVAQESADR
jgi:hypothetical protein